MRRSPSQFSPGFGVVVAIAIIWAMLTFYLALAFGLPLAEQTVPQWYLIVAYILEEGAFLGSAWLCLRNWRYPQLVSDRRIWLFLSLGASLYCLGNLCFFYWDVVLQRAPDVSLGDPFYVVSYLLFLTGMLFAVSSRGLYLKVWQWVALVIVAGGAIALAWLATNPPPRTQSYENLINAGTNPYEIVAATTNFLALTEAPIWVVAIEESLKPFVGIFSWLYLINDVLLVIMAAILLMNFWGGRFSQTWTLIALAALLLYIADIRYAYMVARGDYITNSIVDTFWTLSAIFLGVGAAWEYDLSIHPRRR
jgi:hypothetical protein